jgi:hypothetical protein
MKKANEILVSISKELNVIQEQLKELHKMDREFVEVKEEVKESLFVTEDGFDIKKYKVKISIPFYGKGATLQTDSDGYCHYYSMSFKPSGYPDLFTEIKEPLFITEDGKSLYDLTERVFGVCPKGSWETNYYSGEGIPLEIMDFTVYSPWKYFSTKEAAEKWIKENKPKFSEKQVLDAIYKIFPAISYTHDIREKLLKELGL